MARVNLIILLETLIYFISLGLARPTPPINTQRSDGRPIPPPKPKFNPYTGTYVKSTDNINGQFHERPELILPQSLENGFNKRRKNEGESSRSNPISDIGNMKNMDFDFAPQSQKHITKSEQELEERFPKVINEQKPIQEAVSAKRDIPTKDRIRGGKSTMEMPFHPQTEGEQEFSPNPFLPRSLWDTVPPSPQIDQLYGYPYIDPFIFYGPLPPPASNRIFSNPPSSSEASLNKQKKRQKAKEDGRNKFSEQSTEEQEGEEEEDNGFFSATNLSPSTLHPTVSSIETTNLLNTPSKSLRNIDPNQISNSNSKIESNSRIEKPKKNMVPFEFMESEGTDQNSQSRKFKNFLNKFKWKSSERKERNRSFSYRELEKN
ncbi:hypothetical protein HMI54_002098 [Coelomomyces lativittatus]|nr:hypothetical protein HMI55_001664 [Coelomomyces lativittatus]KAJ1509808.1 hypothetical protein HMI54_002098 [Coelomomyces lativittatus]KAJ1515925.1 hypothetical protein HMI56_006151 [Coelomomyces lativittatus]